MPRPVLILGTGGTCRDILDAVRAGRDPELEGAGFLDDNAATWGTEVDGAPVLGGVDRAPEYPDHLFVNGVGSPSSFLIRPEVARRAGVPRERWATVLHPSAQVASGSTLGAGTVLFQNVTVTTRVAVGDHVLVLPHSVLSHDCRVGHHVLIAGGVVVSGDVEIGDSCYLGAGCLVRQGLRIGEGSLIGMGAVVIGDVPPYSVMVGNPARRLRSSR